MKTVVDNSTLATLWVAQSQAAARSSSGSFNASHIASYGTTIGAIIKAKDGRTAYLLNSTKYSNTTSVMQGIVRYAVPADALVFMVPGVDRWQLGEFADSKRVLKALEAKRAALLDESESSREPKKSRLRDDAANTETLMREYREFVAA